MARTPVGLWVLGGGSVVLAAGIAAWLALRVQPAPPVPVTQPMAAPETRPAGQPAAAPSPSATPAASAPAAPVLPAPPAFDVVRVEVGGGALVAGRAAPGAEVVLSLDEVPVTRTLADPAGQFVAIFDLGESAVPQVLTLATVLADGSVLASPDVVVLAPRGGAVPGAGPVPADPEPPVAAVAPAPEPEPEPEPTATAALDAPEPGSVGTAPLAGDAPVEAAAPPEAVPDPVAETAAVDGAESVPPDPATGAVELAALADPAPGAEPGPETVPQPAPESTQQTAPETASAGALGVPAETAADTAAETTPEPEPAPPAAFVVEGGGGVRLLDRAPQVLDNVVIDAIGYGPGGDVQISGRTRQTGSGTPLRVYLNNRPVAVARSEAGDWRLDLPQVDPGVYTLRVDELAPDGRVVSRFETPFLREDPAAVARLFGTSAPTQPAAAETAAEPAAETPAAPPLEAPVVASAPRPETTPPAIVPAEDAAPDLSADASREAAPEAPSEAPSEARPEALPGAPVTAATTAAAEPRPTTGAAPQPVHPVASPAPAPRVTLVTVQPGHTLWRLSREHYGEGTRYLQIYRANRAQIRDPDLIYPGQIFAIPD